MVRLLRKTAWGVIPYTFASRVMDVVLDLNKQQNMEFWTVMATPIASVAALWLLAQTVSAIFQISNFRDRSLLSTIAIDAFISGFYILPISLSGYSIASAVSMTPGCIKTISLVFCAAFALSAILLLRDLFNRLTTIIDNVQKLEIFDGPTC